MSRDLFHLDDDDDTRLTRNGGVSSNTIDLEMVLHYDTGKAVQVSDTGEEKRAVWLPKSQIEIDSTGKSIPAVKKDGQHSVLPVVSIRCPEWLAKDKGLI